MLVSIVIPTLQGGGAERVAISLANHWASHGMQVEFVLMKFSKDSIGFVHPQVSIHSLKALKIRESILPMRSYFAERQPAVTLVSMWPLTSAAIIAWQLAGKPGTIFVQDHTNLSVACVKELKLGKLYMKSLLRLTYPLATGVMAVSEGVKHDLCCLGGFGKERVEVIYNPAASVLSGPESDCDAMSEQLWGQSFGYNILAVGMLKTQKNFSLLIRAFAQLPKSLNAKLVIVGEGILRSELENLILELAVEDRVSLPGFVLDPSPWFRSADLFVLSSSWEGFGNVIVEALQFGVPVVSTDCHSGPAEILENGRYGSLVPVDDSCALAAAMQASLLDEHDHEALRRRAQDFAVPKISDQYLAYFRSMGAKV